MKKVPFITACLPELSLGSKPEISFKELRDLLSLNIGSADQERVSQLLRLVDLDNVKAFWLALPLSSEGTMGAKELEEALLIKDFLPSFLVEFLDRYETVQERISHFPEMHARLYQEMEESAKGFVRSYYSMERDIRLVLMALRAKKLGRDLVQELQFEDMGDPFVMQILVQRDSPDYIAPQEYEALQNLFLSNSSDPMKLHRSLLEYRFHRILDLEEQYSSFSMDRILGFLARLMIVDMWSRLDKEKGLSLVDDLSKNG